MKLYLPLLLTLGLMTANAFAQQQVFKGATLYDGNGGEPIANSVVVGKNADLVVLEEDPGKDVSAFRSISHVMRFGKLHNIADLSYANEKAGD